MAARSSHYHMKNIAIMGMLTFILFIGDISKAQDTDDFVQRISLAIESDDKEELDSLIAQNRLKVKPFLLDLLNADLTNSLKGSEVDRNSKIDRAYKVAMTFYQLHNERSLLNIVKEYKDLSLEDKRLKFYADSLTDLASSQRLEKDTRRKAIEHFEIALEAYGSIGCKYGMAIVYGGLGAAFWYISPDTCKIYYKKALNIRLKLDDKSLSGDTYNGLGSLYYRHLIDYDSSLYFYNRAEDIRREIGDTEKLAATIRYKARTYLDYGIYVRNKGKYEDALDILQVSMNFFEEVGDDFGKGDVLTQKGRIYNLIGDFTSAIKTLSEALEIFEGKDTWGTAAVFNNMGITYHDAGKPERAAQYYNKALEYFEALDDKDNIITTLNNIGIVSWEMEDYIEAEKVHLKALELCRSLDMKTLEISILINLGNDQNKLNKLDEALRNYELSLTLSEEMSYIEGKWKTLVGIAENYRLRGDIEKAIEYNEKGFALIEELRTALGTDEYRTKYLAKERYAFEEVVNMLCLQHLEDSSKEYDKKAFQFAEQSKSRALLDLLAESIDTENTNILKTTITLDQIQSSCLDNKTLLLEYSLGEENSWLWAISNKERNLFKIPGREKLEEEVELLRFALQSPGKDRIESFAESSNRMYSQILDPAGSLIQNGTRIIIVPDGILNYLPFEALLSSKPTGALSSTYSDLPYLVKTNPVSYAQSASVFNNILENKVKKVKSYSTDLVAFGDPVYNVNNSQNADGLQRLINSGREIELISKYFPAKKSKLFLREAATEDAIKRKSDLLDSRYIHFATHGLIDEVNPQASSLVLAMDSDPAEDGFLRTSEIFKLSTSAELVVLSSCQTGLGKLVRGEGMVGLSRAFIYAGAPSVLVSLWNVSDESTSVLMNEFYRNLLKKSYSKSEAIQKAQVSMIQGEKYAHPFYWAAFILLGDWQ